MKFLKVRRAALDMGQLFIGFMLIIVGLSLFPTVQTTVDTQGVNATGATAAILDLVPLIWVLVVCGIGIGLVYVQFKKMRG